jgi:hypothetical protein
MYFSSSAAQPKQKASSAHHFHIRLDTTTMFILQTTTAILISFLAVLAYNEVRNRLAKGRSRRKDLETPGSPTIPVTSDGKPPLQDEGVNASLFPGKEEPVCQEIEKYKRLYHQLHHLERNDDIMPECRQLLLSLLSSTLMEASEEPDDGILSVEKFSRKDLDSFLKAKDVNVTNQWEDYLARRRAGGLREMFSDKAEAQWWLKQAAPVKYVDGAWLGHINKISTPFRYRNITKNAWQVMSEELGDGDLAKNHVHVYRELMNDIDAGLPAGDSEDFIHPRHQLNEVRCWKAALAQMLVSLFPNDFLPEALGFNMAYESLPLHLLKTVKELREVRLNPYYFELHVSIDNADSGHAAMAMTAVVDYIDVVKQTEGPDAAHIAWKRVQAGYILAEGLPTTPDSPSLKTLSDKPFPRTKNEAAVIDIFAAKSFVAHKIHCNSRLRIGRKSLVEWLEPNAFKNPWWQKDFLDDLSNCEPWVIKGDSYKSRLVKELSWEGKMFGSFTQTEVEVVKAWIDELDQPKQSSQPDATAYLEFTQQRGINVSGIVKSSQDILIDYPVLSVAPPTPSFTNRVGDMDDDTIPVLTLKKLEITNLLSLWFVTPTLLESLPSVPVRAASLSGSALIRVLRAQIGFDFEGAGVAGMDEVRRTYNGHAVGIIELGFEICQHANLNKPANMREAVSLGNADMVAFAEWMVWIGMHWLENHDMLVGMTWSFMELHEMLAEADEKNAFLGSSGAQVLRDIAARERKGLELCKKEILDDEVRNAEFRRGTRIARQAISACFV